MLNLRVSAGGDLPIYRQIMRQIGDAIAAGKLAPGDRLPSLNEVSAKLVIAPLTVKKAYDELEAQGHVESRRGSGTFVASMPPRILRAERDARLDDAARTLLRQAYLAGLDYEGILALIDRNNRKLNDRPASPSRRRRA